MGNYKLTVGNVAGITTTTNGTDCKFGNNTFYVSIQTLTYSKRIFAPGEIHTVLSLTAKDNNSATPTLSQLQDTFSRKKVTLIDTTPDPDVTLADNYFVYKMKPCRSKNSEGSVILKVELSIFSMDKLMTIDKYCNVFTAKRLGEDIFKGELKKFWLDSKNQLKGEVNMQMLAFQNQDTDNMSEVRQPYLVQYNESFYDFLARTAIRCGEMLYFEGGLLHLGMKPALKASTDQSSKTDIIDFEDCVERVLAVQDRHYNFFDRSSNNDNRYTDSYSELVGNFKNTEDEFLDEDTKEEKKRIKNKKKIIDKVGSKEKGKETETAEYEFERGKVTQTVETTYYTASDAAPENELKEQPKQKTTTISVTDSGGNELWKQTKTVTYTYTYDEENGHYKINSKKEFVCSEKESELTIKGQEVEGIYNQPEANDANFVELEKDGYTNFSNESFDYRLMLLNLLYIALNDTSLYNIISDIFWSVAQTAKDAHVAMEKKNAMNNDKNLTLDKDKNPEQTNGTIFNLFSTLKSIIENKDLNVNKQGDIVSLLMADFYAKMRRVSQSVSEMLVRLNYGASDQGLCLGDVIKVEGEFYVVIKVELDENNNYIVEAIPPFYKKVSTDNTTISEAIPCPPLMPEIPTVRTAEAQVAFVEDNLDPNRFGRVRVRYPWQPGNGDKSPWVRMATPFATAGGGVTFRPCTGDEVLLNYEDGNIERPYIVGSLQSKYVTDPWLPLPDRVIRSKNGHSITFNDSTDGANFLYGLLPAASMIKSWCTNYKPGITNQNMVDLTGGINITDRYGLYQINMSSDRRRVNIASPLGSISLNAFTGITITAPNGNIKIAGKNVSISASNKLTLASGTAVGDHFVNPPDNLKSVSSWAKWGLGTIADDVFNRTAGRFIDLSFFRTILEVFTRPVDGTLKIKSNSYVLIEAGKGRAETPIDNLSHPRREKIKSGNKDVRVLGDLLRSIDILTSKADTLCNDIKTAYVKVLASINDYKTYRDEDHGCHYNDLTKMKIDGDNNIIQRVYDKRNNKVFWISTIIKDTDFDFDNTEGYDYWQVGGPDAKFVKREKREDENKQAYELDIKNARDAFDAVKKLDIKIEKMRDNRVSYARKLGSDLKALFDAAKAWKDFDLTKQEKWSCYYSDSLRDTIRGFDIFKGEGPQAKGLIEKINDGTIEDQDFGTFDTEMKVLRRKIVYQIINEVNGKDDYAKVFKKIEPLIEPQYDDVRWVQFTDKIKAPDEFFSKKGTLAKVARSYLMDGRGSAWIDAISVTNRWRSPEKGRILLSDTAGETLQFDGGVLVKNGNVTGVNTAYAIELKKRMNKV